MRTRCKQLIVAALTMMRSALHRAGAVALQRACSERRSAYTLGVALVTPLVSPLEDPGARARHGVPPGLVRRDVESPET